LSRTAWIWHARCEDDDDDDDEGDDDARLGVAHDGGGGDREDCSRGKLRGPVTEIDEEGFTFAVMGTWVTADESSFPEDLEVGDRVDVRVHHGDEDELVVDTVKEWHNDHYEQVHGRIDGVEMENGAIHLRVLNTTVVVMRMHRNTP
jgi:hypothetical protein